MENNPIQEVHRVTHISKNLLQYCFILIPLLCKNLCLDKKWKTQPCPNVYACYFVSEFLVYFYPRHIYKAIGVYSLL